MANKANSDHRITPAGAPVKIVAGGGVQGVYIVAQPGLDKPEKLKGKTLGTFQNDTLEVLPDLADTIVPGHGPIGGAAFNKFSSTHFPRTTAEVRFAYDVIVSTLPCASKPPRGLPSGSVTRRKWLPWILGTP